MPCEITNRTPRLMSFRGNSGQTWHLPPHASVEVMEVEVTNNAKIAKLAAKGVITVQQTAPAEAPTSPPERGRRARA